MTLFSYAGGVNSKKMVPLQRKIDLRRVRGATSFRSPDDRNDLAG